MDDPLPRQLMLQLFLILLNAFFACTEIAVISLNDNKLRLKAESGQKSAQKLVKLTAQPARFLATIQIGITFAGLLGSAFAADNFASRLVEFLVKRGVSISPDTLNTLSVVAITFVLSFFTLVFGELVPKRIAMQKSEPIAMAVSHAIYVLSRIAAPFVWLLTASTNGVLRLFRMSTRAEEASVTGEEIRMMVDLGEEKGTIAPDEGEMIDNVLELSSKSAVELMTHRTDVVALWMEDSQEEWEETIRTTSHSRYPVCGKDLDEIVGILHVRDFFCELKGKPITADMLRPPYLVPETAQADVLFREMKRAKTHMAVVVDEYGGTSGIITMENLLEEIVGQIEDEYDQEDPDIVTLSEGVWRVRGSMLIADLEDELSLDLPEGDFDTVGGLIFAQMHSIPKDGTNPEVSVAGLHFTVEELSDHRVEWAQISLEPPQSPEPGGSDSDE